MIAKKEAILNKLKDVIANVYETDSERVDVHASFLEMGLDSITIVQVKQLVKNTYGFDVPVDRLFGDVSNLDKLTEFIIEKLPADKTQPAIAVHNSVAIEQHYIQPAPKMISSQPLTKRPVSGTQMDVLQGIINDQLQVMKQQIEMLASYGKA